LTALGAGDYLGRFIAAGYDFDSIGKLGLDDDDLDCVGITKEKRGLRKKLKNLSRIAEFQDAPEEKSEESASEEGSGDEEGSGEEDD
jgi:TATA-binding protein-associated factor Taf7